MGLQIEIRPESPYSVDENLWGRSIEAGVLEDAILKPPEDAFLWTASVDSAPASPALIELGFERGVPTSLINRSPSPSAAGQGGGVTPNSSPSPSGGGQGGGVSRNS